MPIIISLKALTHLKSVKAIFILYSNNFIFQSEGFVTSPDRYRLIVELRSIELQLLHLKVQIRFTLI